MLHTRVLLLTRPRCIRSLSSGPKKVIDFEKENPTHQKTEPSLQRGPSVIAPHPFKETEPLVDGTKFFPLCEASFKSEGLPKRFAQALDKVGGERHWMLRPRTAKLLSKLRDPATRQPGYILSGPTGTGKSVAMAQIVEYCRSHDWIVLYLPSGRAMGFEAPSVTPSAIYPGLFDLDGFGVELLEKFHQANSTRLETIELTKDMSELFAPLEVRFDGRTMADLVQFGLDNPEAASAVAVELIYELGRVQEREVLIAVDEFNWLYFDTVFGHQGQPVAPHDIALIRALKPFNRTGFRRKALANGTFIGAYTENYPTSFEIRTEIACKKAQLIKYANYTRREMESVMKYYNEIKFTFGT